MTSAGFAPFCVEKIDDGYFLLLCWCVLLASGGLRVLSAMDAEW